MKLTYISTYPPRECGLASFNKSLINAVNANSYGKDYVELEGSVVAINDNDIDEYPYPPEVNYVIRQQVVEDYVKAASFINKSDADACILQHEFGIFGGNSGVYVLSLINQLEKPLISIFHTILERPTFEQKKMTHQLCKKKKHLRTIIIILSNLLKHEYKIELTLIFP